MSVRGLLSAVPDTGKHSVNASVCSPQGLYVIFLLGLYLLPETLLFFYLFIKQALIQNQTGSCSNAFIGDTEKHDTAHARITWPTFA